MKISIRSTNPHHYDEELIPAFTHETANINFNCAEKHQVHYGFGGALTDSAGYVYQQMPEALQKEFLQAVYSANGLNYNLGRIPIASCDFSLSTYDFITLPDQSDFSLTALEQYLLPLLHDVQKHKSLMIMASSWSPPAIYKNNHQRTHGGKLLPRYYPAYAKYIIRFIQALSEKNVFISQLTIQNEPLATQVWESCLFTGAEEVRLARLLRTELNQANLSNIGLFGWDHNRDKMVVRANALFKNNNIFAGIAYHWYDQGVHAAIKKVATKYHDKLILFTEGCVELLHYQQPQNAVGLYAHALRYAHNYLRDILAGSQGFMDWNILLDNRGGPNHVGNYCEAPLMYDVAQRKLIYNPSYYAIKHFSQFIQVGAQRIDAYAHCSDLEVCAYQNPDDSLVIMIINNGNQQKIILNFANQNMMCYIENDSITSVYITK